MIDTCPNCRHPVEVPDEGVVKCPNCGTKMSEALRLTSTIGPPRTNPVATAAHDHAAGEATAAESPGVASRMSPPVSPIPASALPPPDQPVTRAASVVSFVAGLLFFVPFITQAIGIVAGLIALFRRRRPNERVGLAWVGLALSVAMIPVWGFLFVLLRNLGPTAGGGGMARVGYTGAFRAASRNVTWEVTAEWMTLMERVHKASRRYRRDFNRWPDSIEVLIAKEYVRKNLRLPDGFTLYPVPTGTVDMERVLLVSAEVEWDAEGHKLSGPNRLVLRISGKTNLLPSPQVEELLADQGLGGTDGDTAP